MNFNVSTWHVGEEGAPAFIDQVATNDMDEKANGGGIVVVEIKREEEEDTSEPIIASAIGMSDENPALTEVRKIMARDSLEFLTPEERQEALRLMAGEIVRKGVFHSSGAVFHPEKAGVSGVKPEEISAAFPKQKKDGTVIIMADGLPEPDVY